MCGGSPLSAVICEGQCFLFCSRCRGEYTGEENDNCYSRSPLSEPVFIWLLLFLFVRVGEITQGSRNLYSRSPLSEPVLFLFLLCFG